MIIREETNDLRTTTLLDPRAESLVRKYMPSYGALEQMSAVFTALADTGRLKIVSALSVSEMCVSDLSAVLGVNQTTLSHQLRFLRSAEIVTCKKQGKIVFYSIAKPLINDLMLIAAKILGSSRSA